jgi:hypothetical protein
MIENQVFVHGTAIVNDDVILGSETTWANLHVMPAVARDTILEEPQ